MPKLTDKMLKTLAVEPGRKDRLIFDRETPGLGVRVTVAGTKSFLVQWTDPATKRKVREPLGVWGSITIEQARAAARARLGDVAKGIDPSAERRERKAQAEAAKAEEALTLDALIDQWGTLHLSQRRPRYAAEAQRAIRLAFTDYLRRPAARLTKAQVISVLDALARAGKATTAGRTMAYARAAYAWAEKRGKVPTNPFKNLPIAAGTSQRDRVLDDGELAEVWRAAGAMPYPFGPFYKLAILTLQRREEVAAARWPEFSDDLTTWTIPGARMKNGKQHVVHLSEPARAVLRGIMRIEGQDLIFSTTGKTAISGQSRAKRQIDDIIAKARLDANPKAKPMPPWRLHDFRRTGVSKLAALSFDSIVVDKILAHQPSKLKGVAAVYQRHDFAKERAIALDAWAAHVVGGAPEGNVIRLERKA